MKHAGADALDRLETLLAVIRSLPGLTEKGRGVFYRGGRAFLHFHEDPKGLFADARLTGADFDRLRVETAEERDRLLASLSAELKKGPV